MLAASCTLPRSSNDEVYERSDLRGRLTTRRVVDIQRKVLLRPTRKELREPMIIEPLQFKFERLRDAVPGYASGELRRAIVEN